VGQVHVLKLSVFKSHRKKKQSNVKLRMLRLRPSKQNSVPTMPRPLVCLEIKTILWVLYQQRRPNLLDVPVLPQ